MIFNIMNLSEKLQELTKALRQFSATPAPAAPLAFSDYKLEDGTMVRVDGELAVGTLVYVITEEGLLPAPDGAHSIPEVGVVTTEGGKIVEIGEVAAAPAEPEAVEAQEVEIEVAPEGEAMPADPHEERMAAMEAAIAALAAKVEELMAKMGGEVEATAKRFSTIDTALSALAQMPTAAPKKRASDAIVESVKLSKANRLAELNETLKNLKK
jgi:hypothetical protein